MIGPLIVNMQGTFLNSTILHFEHTSETTIYTVKMYMIQINVDTLVTLKGKLHQESVNFEVRTQTQQQ